ncbi:hypothetical protein I3842_11G007200 [Carya illinoinensis]|uniref:GRF-type domain-containing protein n=1 Tax=Carya illinoinensis TaxID=32201 RepID=A0A922IXG9_CARIL|nr:hypothetical protein I3842_11G007200 [Carya illinoinensis]
MASSSASSECTGKGEDKACVERPFCYCGCQASLRISRKSNSFGRRFYNCPNYKMKQQCEFFEWIDLQSDQNNCCKLTLELAERRNERVLHERLRIEQTRFKSMEKKYNRVLIVLILSWFYFFWFVL